MISPGPGIANSPDRPRRPDHKSVAVSGGWGKLVLPLLAVLLLGESCLVLPIPSYRTEPRSRKNVNLGVAQSLTPGQLSRAEVLLQLGEPDEVSPDERQFRYYSERVQWDIIVIVGGGGSAAVGDIQVKKHRNLLLRFDEQGKLSECRWVEGYNPKNLRQRGRWTATNAPPSAVGDANRPPGSPP